MNTSKNFIFAIVVSGVFLTLTTFIKSVTSIGSVQFWVYFGLLAIACVAAIVGTTGENK